jgi:hypothetical protein
MKDKPQPYWFTSNNNVKHSARYLEDVVSNYFDVKIRRRLALACIVALAASLDL